MITLALDTASSNCAVALVADGKVLARISETIGKGHAEKLIDQIELVCKAAVLELEHIDRIAVNIGPGSFTGVRIAVSTARALALALEKPAIGVSSLEALAYEAKSLNAHQPICVVIHAGRDMLYRQDFDDKGLPVCDPFVQTFEQAMTSLPKAVFLGGSAAVQLAQMAQGTKCHLFENQDADVVTYAHCGATKAISGSPRPLYLRDADAKPQSGFALPRRP